MQDEEAMTVATRFYDALEDFLVTGATEALDNLTTPNALGISSDGEDVMMAIGAMRSALAGMKVTVDDMFAKGDHVTTLVSVVASHDSDLLDLPASGERINVNEVHVLRIVDGKVATIEVRASDQWRSPD